MPKAYLITLPQYVETVAPLLKEFKTFLKKNNYFIYAGYGGYDLWSYPELVQAMKDKKRVGISYDFSKEDKYETPQEKLDYWWNRDAAALGLKKDAPDYVVQQKNKYIEKLNEVYDEIYVERYLSESDNLKSNKRAIKYAIDRDVYSKLLKSGEADIDTIRAVAESAGVKIPKKVTDSMPINRLNDEKYAALYKLLPPANMEQLKQLVKDIEASFKDFSDKLYEKEFQRNLDVIKQIQGMSEITPAKIMELIVKNYDGVFADLANERIVREEEVFFATKWNPRERKIIDWYSIPSLTHNWEANLISGVKRYVEQLKYPLVASILTDFNNISKPIKSFHKEFITVRYESMEGFFHFDFVDGSSFDYTTKSILAGGYNIQVLHLRYISDFLNATSADGTKLPTGSLYRILENFVDKNAVEESKNPFKIVENATSFDMLLDNLAKFMKTKLATVRRFPKSISYRKYTEQNRVAPYSIYFEMPDGKTPLPLPEAKEKAIKFLTLSLGLKPGDVFKDGGEVEEDNERFNVDEAVMYTLRYGNTQDVFGVFEVNFRGYTNSGKAVIWGKAEDKIGQMEVLVSDLKKKATFEHGGYIPQVKENLLQIAHKHSVPVEKIKEQFILGTKKETESNTLKRADIVKRNLITNPEFYSAEQKSTGIFTDYFKTLPDEQLKERYNFLIRQLSNPTVTNKKEIENEIQLIADERVNRFADSNQKVYLSEPPKQNETSIHVNFPKGEYKLIKEYDNGYYIENVNGDRIKLNKSRFNHELKAPVIKKIKNFTVLLKGEQLASTTPLPEKELKYYNSIFNSFVAGTELNNRVLDKIAVNCGLMDNANNVNKGLVKELTELAICNYARTLAHESGTVEERYNNIVEFYEQQPLMSHRTSESMLMQQYSTPVPLCYIAGIFCFIDKSGLYFEPSAGNGNMTVAGLPQDFIVNEIDKIRNRNLKTVGYKEVLSIDGSEPFKGFEKKFDAVLTNPPFGSVETTILFNGMPIKKLEHAMAIYGLQTMKDNGKSAIIIGGHTTFDEQGRIQKGQNRDFFSYLYRYYHVSDVINISGNLYTRQGTSIGIRLILIGGRKEKAEGFPPLLKKESINTDVGSDKLITTFGELLNRIKKSMQ